MGLSAKIVMVASGKGGTGKSTLSVMLGARLAAAGGKVLLIELDSGLRSVDIIAGVYGKTVYDIADVLSGRCEGAKAVVASPVYPGLSVISAPYEWSGTVQPAALKKLLDKLSPVFDWVLVDTAAGLGAPFKAALAVSETVLLVLTPDGTRAKAMVTVWSGPKELTLTAEKTQVTRGGTVTLAAADETGAAVDASTLAWSSSDEAIATVDETGTVTAVAAGEVVITAETAYEIAGSVTITIG